MDVFIAWLAWFWGQITGPYVAVSMVALDAILALVIRRLEKRFDERRSKRTIRRALKASADAKKASVDAWVQYIRKETAKARTHLRWSLEWDPDFTTMWNLVNNGPGPVRNLQFAVRHGKNLSAITVLNEMDCDLPLALELGGPERAQGQVLLLKWDDDSGTDNGYQIPVARQVRPNEPLPLPGNGKHSGEER